MRKVIAGAVVAVMLTFSGCASKYPEKKISFDDYEGVTIEYTCESAEGEAQGTIAYKKTECGFVFYEIADDGTEYVCETEGDEFASFVKAKDGDKFSYQEVAFGENSVFSDDAAYYRYNFAYYGFDFGKELGKLEFEKQADGEVGGRACYVYTAEYDGSVMKISVDKENGLWLSVEDSGVVYTVTKFEFNADIIPEYK